MSLTTATTLRVVLYAKAKLPGLPPPRLPTTLAG
jgi:hypothetical protein